MFSTWKEVFFRNNNNSNSDKNFFWLVALIWKLVFIKYQILRQLSKIFNSIISISQDAPKVLRSGNSFLQLAVQKTFILFNYEPPTLTLLFLPTKLVICILNKEELHENYIFNFQFSKQDLYLPKITPLPH